MFNEEALQKSSPAFQQKRSHKGAGFTLFEIVLSVGAMVIIFAFSAPVYQSLAVRNDLEGSVNAVVQTFRRAQLLAQAVQGDTTWGMHVGGGNISLFMGTSYATRDPNFDEIFSLPNTITATGVTEVVFSKFFGLPQTTGTTTLTTSNNNVRTININDKGMISY